MIDTRRFRSIPGMPAAIALLLAATALQACAGVVVGAGATAGLAAYEERGITGVTADTVTATKIHTKMIDHSIDLARHVDVEVYGGRAMLTGAVPDEQMRADAVRIAWSVGEIKNVLNEIVVEENGVIDAGRDGVISTRLYAKMTSDSEILAINYSIETVNGVVYLIGTAQSDKELKRVIDHARNIPHVRRVVNHVVVKPGAGAQGS
jgi:osmotically-inducible protein OsmY